MPGGDKQVCAYMETHRDSPAEAWCHGCCGWPCRKRKAGAPGWTGGPGQKAKPAGYKEPAAKPKDPPKAPGQWPGFGALKKAPPVPKAKVAPKPKPKTQQPAEHAAAMLGVQATGDALVYFTQNANEATAAAQGAAVAMGDLLGVIAKGVAGVGAAAKAAAKQGAAAKPAEPKPAEPKPAEPKPAEPKEAPEAAPKDGPVPPAAPAPLAPGQAVPIHASGTVQLAGFSQELQTLLSEAHAGRTDAQILATPAVQALGKTPAMNFAALNLGLALLRPGQRVGDFMPSNSPGADSYFERWRSGESLSQMVATLPPGSSPATVVPPALRTQSTRPEKLKDIPQNGCIGVHRCVGAEAEATVLAVVVLQACSPIFVRCEVQHVARSWRRHHLNRTPGEGKRAAAELAALY